MFKYSWLNQIFIQIKKNLWPYIDRALTKDNIENLTSDLDATSQVLAEEISTNNNTLNQEIPKEGESLINL